MNTLQALRAFTDTLPRQGVKMPVLFTSHGNPMDIPLDRTERPFWNTLFELGKDLQAKNDVKAAVVISAHWCTEGTWVNVSPQPEQIYDYYGFPDEYYSVKYSALGAPEIAREVAQLVPSIHETTEWGLDHGAWPMLMHLFPEGNVPVFQLSLSYHASPKYHWDLGRQLAPLRDKGVLIIGSGSLIHNLGLAGRKMRLGDMTPYGWEAEYDEWIKTKIAHRDFDAVVNYWDSHPLGKLAAPTPDHYVPVLYSLALAETRDEIIPFYEAPPTLPAFSERSFVIGGAGR